MIRPWTSREPAVPGQAGFEDVYMDGVPAVQTRPIRREEFDTLRRRGIAQGRKARAWLFAVVVLFLVVFELHMALGFAALWYSGPLVALALSLLVMVVDRSIQEARRLGAIGLESEVTLFRSGPNQQHDVWVTVPGGVVIESSDPFTPPYVRLRYAAPMPESARLQVEAQLGSGATEGTRKLTASERAELRRRKPAMDAENNYFYVPLAGVPIYVAAWTKSWLLAVVALFLAGLVFVWTERKRQERLASQTEVRIVADANVLGSKARWVEYLGDDEQRPWTMNGRPAWWRIE